MKIQKSNNTAALASVESISTLITAQRGQRVMLDVDLARLYGVSTKRLNEQVKRNRKRFPDDFVFQLTKAEAEMASHSRSQFATLNDATSSPSRSQSVTLNDPGNLKSQIATSKRGTNIKYLPYVFTEHGVIMAANVLNSARAVQTSVLVVRAFVRIRRFLATHVELAQKLDELQGKLDRHDQQIVAIIDAIRQLMAEPATPKKPPIGYQTEASTLERKTVRRRGKK